MIGRDTVQMGENIVTLASRLTGDPMKWQEIVRLNRLNPPYISENGAAGTLAVGDAVLYPAPDLPTAPINVTQLLVNTYRRDWVAQGGDLVLSDTGHLTTQGGLENLRTAITRRLTTLLGQHPFHPNYGSLIPLHVGQVMDIPRARLIVADAHRAIMRDPRVTACNVEVDWSKEVLTLNLTVTPIPPGSPFRQVVQFQ